MPTEPSDARDAAAEEAVAEAPKEPFDLINKSVARAAALLFELGRHPRGLTATELAQAVDVTRPTAFRLLLTLEQSGLIDRADTRYTLGWQLARLGRAADPYTGVVARVQPVLDDYAARINENLALAMLRGETDFDLIAEASGSRLLNASNQYIGGTFPLHASATGKIILAELDDARIEELLPARLTRYTPRTITSRKALLTEVHQIREQGYSLLEDELEEGLFTVGCPVRDTAGSLLGILAVNGPTQRLKSARLPETIATLQEATEQVSKALR